MTQVQNLERLRDRLRKHFGFRHFRPGQAEAVEAAMEGQDTLVIMPTGSGKSLCFQLPALELTGTTVVVSPLLALMRDQVEDLRARKVRVVEISSALSRKQREVAEREIANGQVEFVYTTPEQLSNPCFRERFNGQTIDLFVVDEAHCISHWGHDFRPAYLGLADAVEKLGRPPILAMTATATSDVIHDVMRQLRMPEATIVHTGFYRPNLHLSVVNAKGPEEKLTWLIGFLRENDGTSIIYSATVKVVEEIAEFLKRRGLAVGTYHGRMSVKRRHAIQDQFMKGDLPILIATNAFGLGIDKPDIRAVIHFHMPANLESFYQEFGRAGRDGQAARGILLYDSDDRKIQRFFQANRYPNEDDLVNAHHAVECALEGSPNVTLSRVESVSPLSKSKTKVCIEMLVRAGVIERKGRGLLQLAKLDVDREYLARVSAAYRERAELDEIKQQRMIEYAESRTCRWNLLLEYFEDLPSENWKCSHCDNDGAEFSTFGAELIGDHPNHFNTRAS